MIGTVGISDPLPVFRGGLRAALTQASFVVCEPADIVGWTRLPQANQGDRRAVLLSLATQTDWVILDRVHDGQSEIAVVALLQQPSNAGYRNALARGALSAAPRGATCEHIVNVVRAAVEGCALLPATVAHAMADSISAASAEGLKEEERRWLRALGDGASVEDLAWEFGYSRRTMYRRLSAIYRRLGADRRDAALLTAARIGLI